PRTPQKEHPVTAHHVATQSNVNRRIIRLAALAGLLGLIGVLSMTASVQSSTTAQTASKPTIVLVHGVWADSSGWNGVIERLLPLISRFPGSLINPESSFDVREYPAADGSTGHDAYIKPELFRQIFAADLPGKETALMAATQRPIEVASFVVPSAAAAWKSIP